MALRPTELQILITATRDIEKVQQIQQHTPRSQQEQLALQFQQQIEEKRRQAQAVVKPEGNSVNKLDSENNSKSNQQKNKRNSSADTNAEQESENSKDDHIIDILV